jgi:NAD(P)H-dependent FMN reductase
VTTKPRIAIVIGSTRPGRYADKAAGWILKQAQARDDIEAELLDLLDHPLPFFDEKGPLISIPSENAEALRWQKTLARHDGFRGGRIQQLDHGCAEECARPSL